MGNNLAAGCTIVVPVFNGFDALSLCFESLASMGLPSACRILLIDDASTDHRIAALMTEFRKRMQDAVDVVRNESNLGFVGTVNRAMSMIEGDVLLLNSDTVVTPNWLVQILRCAESDPKITAPSRRGQTMRKFVLCRASVRTMQCQMMPMKLH